MEYLIYCDISTLKCTEKEFEEKLSDFSLRYCKLDTNFYFFNINKAAYCFSLVSANEYFVTHILRPYTDEKSIVFTQEITKNGYYYEVPRNIEDYLSLEDSDDEAH